VLEELDCIRILPLTVTQRQWQPWLLIVHLALPLTGPLAESAALKELDFLCILEALLPLTVTQHQW
jgi:hypothetical protein